MINGNLDTMDLYVSLIEIVAKSECGLELNHILAWNIQVVPIDARLLVVPILKGKFLTTY